MKLIDEKPLGFILCKLLFIYITLTYLQDFLRLHTAINRHIYILHKTKLSLAISFDNRKMKLICTKIHYVYTNARWIK